MLDMFPTTSVDMFPLTIGVENAVLIAIKATRNMWKVWDFWTENRIMSNRYKYNY